MSTVRLDAIAKQFGSTRIVEDVSLEIAEGELVALLGPSGSGKTTLLRLIAGFEQPDSGRIFLDGDDVTDRPPLARRCGMVFQHYALFPHMTVAENVGYGLAALRLSDSDRSARVGDVLEMVDLAGYQARAVTALSGGQQQRVALARALAPRPRVLLLDEPLSNLDPSLRERTRRELQQVVRRTGVTTVLVTHEQEEAFDIADRIALLHRGRLEQLDTAPALYRTPATPFVAGFVGRASMIAGVVDSPHAIRAGGGAWPVDTALSVGTEVDLVLRPEAARLATDGTIEATVIRKRFAGASTFLSVRLKTKEEIEVITDHEIADGAAIRLVPSGVGVHAWPRT